MCLKGKVIKAIISIVISQDKEAYMIKEAAGYSKGIKGKNLNYYFSQNSTMLQIGAFDVFIFLDNTLSIAVFTLIKLMFETQAAKL